MISVSKFHVSVLSEKVECTHCSKSLTIVKSLTVSHFCWIIGYISCPQKHPILLLSVLSNDLHWATLQAFSSAKVMWIQCLLPFFFLTKKNVFKLFTMSMFIYFFLERIWRDCWTTSISKMKLFTSTSPRREKQCWICTALNLSLCSWGASEIFLLLFFVEYSIKSLVLKKSVGFVVV